MEFIKDLDSDNEPLIITFFGHGGRDGLVAEENGVSNKLYYKEILNAVNLVRTNYPVYLNFLANCYSYCCLDFIGINIVDEIWHTTTEVKSIHLSLQAAMLGDFSKFYNMLDPEQQLQYSRYPLDLHI